MDKITRLSRNEFNNLSLLYFKSPEEMIYKEEDLLRFSDVDVKSYYFTESVMSLIMI